MTSARIIDLASMDGVSLSVSSTGNIKAVGPRAAVHEWLPLIREHKPAIVDALKSRVGELAVIPPTPTEVWQQKVIAMLSDNPTTRRAITSDMQADPESVIVAVGIRGMGTCELSIPKATYDAFRFIELTDRKNVLH